MKDIEDAAPPWRAPQHRSSPRRENAGQKKRATKQTKEKGGEEATVIKGRTWRGKPSDSKSMLERRGMPGTSRLWEDVIFKVRRPDASGRRKNENCDLYAELMPVVDS